MSKLTLAPGVYVRGMKTMILVGKSSLEPALKPELSFDPYAVQLALKRAREAHMVKVKTP